MCKPRVGIITSTTAKPEQPRINTRIKRNLLLVKEVVRCLDTNDEEDWAAEDEVKALQEDVEDEHHARDANISMLYLIKDHDCNV